MQTKHSFKYWQWRVIICSMIGYAMFYFVRKNFSFAIPLLNEEYGISNASFGHIHFADAIIDALQFLFKLCLFLFIGTCHFIISFGCYAAYYSVLIENPNNSVKFFYTPFYLMLLFFGNSSRILYLLNSNAERST